MSSENPTGAPPRGGRAKVSNRRGRRWLPYTGAVLLLALIGVGLWPKPVPVETAPATIGPLRATVNEEGKTRIKQRFLVTAPVSGQLRRLPFKAGAEVRAGETVVGNHRSLPADPPRRALARPGRGPPRRGASEPGEGRDPITTSPCANGIGTRSSSRRRPSRSRKWSPPSGGRRPSRRRRPRRRAPCARPRPSWRPTRAARPANRPPPAAPLEIKAPVSGRILRVFEENSRVVAVGTPLLEIGDPADLEVVIEVLSRDGAIIQPGAKVSLEQWGGAEPLEARVRLVEPAAFTKVSALGVEEQRVNVIADLLTPPERRASLGDQFRVDARIVVWEQPKALQVPSGGVFRRGQRWEAFVVREGRAELRTLEVGQAQQHGNADIERPQGRRGGHSLPGRPGPARAAGLEDVPLASGTSDPRRWLPLTSEKLGPPTTYFDVQEA